MTPFRTAAATSIIVAAVGAVLTWRAGTTPTAHTVDLRPFVAIMATLLLLGAIWVLALFAEAVRRYRQKPPRSN